MLFIDYELKMKNFKLSEAGLISFETILLRRWESTNPYTRNIKTLINCLHSHRVPLPPTGAAVTASCTDGMATGCGSALLVYVLQFFSLFP